MVWPVVWLGLYKYMDKVRGGEGYPSTRMGAAWCCVCAGVVWCVVWAIQVHAWVRPGVCVLVVGEVRAIQIHGCSRRIASASEVEVWVMGRSRVVVVWRSMWCWCGGPCGVGVNVFHGFAMRRVISSITVICKIENGDDWGGCG